MGHEQKWRAIDVLRRGDQQGAVTRLKLRGRALCNAITEHPLVVAWEMRNVACSNCGVVMRMDEGVLTRLRAGNGGAGVLALAEAL